MVSSIWQTGSYETLFAFVESVRYYGKLRELRVARWIYAVTVAKSSRCAESDLFQVPDAPVVELVEASGLV